MTLDGQGSLRLLFIPVTDSVDSRIGNGIAIQPTFFQLSTYLTHSASKLIACRITIFSSPSMPVRQPTEERARVRVII